MGRRRKARELTLQVLFNIEFSNDDPDAVFNLICDNFHTSKSTQEFAKKLVLGISQKREHLDNLISDSSRNWRIERMSKVDKSILRLSVYQLNFCPDIPPKVVINEAIELAKKFSTSRSPAFVNGVLDAVLKKLKTQSRKP